MARPNVCEDHLIPVMNWISNSHTVDETHPKDLVQRKIVRDRIESLADSLIQNVSEGSMKGEDGSLTHYHTKGIYAREMKIPKGTVMVSKIHKLPRLCIILKGDVSFTTEYGSKRIRGPYTAVFPPGSRVALFTHEETLWTAIHGTDETDLELLESSLIAKDHGEYDNFCRQLEEGGE